MTQNGKMNRADDKLEVARIAGVQGIRAAMEVLAREAERGSAGGELGMGAEGESGADAEGGAGKPGAALPVETVIAPHPRKTCAVCAADNDGARDTCWNCGASLRRAR